MQLTYAADTVESANSFHIAGYNVIMGKWLAAIRSGQPGYSVH